MKGHVRLDAKIRDGWEFLTTGIWRSEIKNLPVFRRALFRILRTLNLTIREILKEKIHLRAASLTFYSLLSIVPVLAMLFGLAKGFGLDKVLEEGLLTRVEGQEEVFIRMIGFARNLLESTKGGVIAGVGVVVLFWSVIKIFGSIEKSFNEIWGVTRGRALLRKATDYLSLSLLCAILMAVSSTLTVMITSQATTFVSRVKVLEVVSPAIFLSLKLLPLMAIWVLFTLIYAAIPNTRVRFTSAVVAGIVAGTAFQIFQRLYIEFQIGVAKYNAVYGSFAALPLFLVWLQVSWLIVLIGAYLSFACQNLDSSQPQSDLDALSPRFKKLLALLISSLVVKRFCSEEDPMEDKEIATELKIPIPVAQGLLKKLVACGVLSIVKGNKGEEEAYQPGVDPDRLSIHFVLSRMDQQGLNDLPNVPSESFLKLSHAMEKFSETLKLSQGNVLLKNI